MAGLNFVGNAAYAAPCAGKRNVAQFEFIPWLLGRCANLAEARAALAELNLVGTPFSPQLPAAQLHWLVADRTARSWSSPWRTGCTSTTARRASDEQSALPHPAFRPEPLHGPLAASAGKSLF